MNWLYFINYELAYQIIREIVLIVWILLIVLTVKGWNHKNIGSKSQFHKSQFEIWHFFVDKNQNWEVNFMKCWVFKIFCLFMTSLQDKHHQKSSFVKQSSQRFPRNLQVFAVFSESFCETFKWVLCSNFRETSTIIQQMLYFHEKFQNCKFVFKSQKMLTLFLFWWWVISDKSLTFRAELLTNSACGKW